MDCILEINVYGLTEEKASCLYGGVTIHDGNQLDEEKVIGVNVFKDVSNKKVLL